MSVADADGNPTLQTGAQEDMVIVNPLVEGMAPGGNPLLHGALPRFNHAVTTGLMMISPVYAYTAFQVYKATQSHLAKSGGQISASHLRQILSHASSVLSKQRFAPTVAFFACLHMLDYAWRSQLGLGESSQAATQLQAAVLHRGSQLASALQAATMSAFSPPTDARALPARYSPSPTAEQAPEELQWQVFHALIQRSTFDSTRSSIEDAWHAVQATHKGSLQQWRTMFASPRVPCIDMRRASAAQDEYKHEGAPALARALPLLPYGDLAVALTESTAAAASTAGLDTLPPALLDGSTKWPSTNLKSLPRAGSELLATCADSAAAVQGWCVGRNPVTYAQAAELLTSMPWYDAMLQLACSNHHLSHLPSAVSIALTVQPLLSSGAAWATSTPLDTMLCQSERIALRAARARTILLAQHRQQAGAKFVDSATALDAEQSSRQPEAADLVSHQAVCAWVQQHFTAARVQVFEQIIQGSALPLTIEAIARAMMLKAGLSEEGVLAARAPTAMASRPPWAMRQRPVDADGDPVVFRLPALALHAQQVTQGASGSSALCAVALSSGGQYMEALSAMQCQARQEHGEEPITTQQDAAIESASNLPEGRQSAAESVEEALSVDLVEIVPLPAQSLAVGSQEQDPGKQEDSKHDDTTRLEGIYRAIAFAAEFAQREELVHLMNGTAALEHAAAIGTTHSLAQSTKHAFATHTHNKQPDLAPLSWETSANWTGSALGVISAASSTLQQPEWSPVQNFLLKTRSSLELPQAKAVAAFATNSLPVGVEPRDSQRLLPYLNFSAMGGLAGVAAGVITSLALKRQTMAWTKATALKSHISVGAAVGGVIGAFTSSYEESLRPLAFVVGSAQ